MGNPVLEAIDRRQSVRSYRPDPVPRDVIQAIIEAGNQAPSRGRQIEGSTDFVFQPWRFVVVENPAFKKQLVETTLPFWKSMTGQLEETHPELYQGIMMQYEAAPEPKDMVYYAAPVIVFVIGPSGFDVSCALACENMMLAATSMGLGSCYVGFGSMVKGNAEVVQALELKDEERIFGPIVLGYPQQESGELAAIRTEKREPVIKWI